MAKQLTAKTRSILNQIEKNPSLLLDIEGIDFVTSSSAVLKFNQWDDPTIEFDAEPPFFWDSSRPDPTVKSYIDLKSSTKSISQQIYPDKEGSSSISTYTISMVDKNGEASRAFALNTITEILGKKCTVNLGFVGSNYPEDFITLMNGFIVDYYYEGGSVNITISHADGLRRQAILTEYSSNLDGSIDSSTTTIPVISTSGLLESQDALTSYIKIDDELMSVVSIDSATQITVVREAFTTVAAAHDDDADVVSFYQLQGQPLDLAQKIMQSNEDNSFFDSDIPIISLQSIGNGETVNNAILFSSYNIQRETGLISGDIINVSTLGELTCDQFIVLPNGNSYITVLEDISTLEDASALTWSFKSQYNVLNFGLDMKPFEVDNLQFERIKSFFSPNFVDMNFPIDAGIENCRDFINTELYFVAGCYGIPRDGRSSVTFLSPPLSIEDLPVLNETNILNMASLKPTRSINKFYYNDILYAFDKSFLDGEFKSFSRFINTDSTNRFNVGTKQLRVESQGLDRNAVTELAIDRLASRFLDRYKFASTLIKGIKLPFKTGFNLQVSDVVFFGGASTQLVNYDTGERSLPLEKYEIINQKINLDGTVEIDILETGFSVTGTYGVFSPSSLVQSATTSSVTVKKINNLDEFSNEGDKYSEIVGSKLRIRSEDYTYDETVTLNSVDPQNPNRLLISTVSVAPSADYIVELANYDDYEEVGVNDTDDFIKQKYTFTMNQDSITAVTNDSTFTVTDGSDFFVGQLVAVHSGDFTRDAENAIIESISTNEITLTEDLPFTPVIGDLLEQKSFSDLDGYLLL